MYPIFVEIGNFSIRWYGVMAAIGFIWGAWIINKFKDHARINEEQATAAVLIAAVGGLIGARIFYVVQYFDQFRRNLWGMLMIFNGGLVFYGGFFLAIAALFVYCRVKKIDFIRLLDVFSVALPLGHAMGRVGCFLNGCCYGKMTSSCLAVNYPIYDFKRNVMIISPVHPVQLYEAAASLLVFVIMFSVMKKYLNTGKLKPGIMASSYLIVYGFLRFGDEFFRGDHAPNYLLDGWMTPAQVIGLGIIPVGVAALFYFKCKKNPDSELKED